METTIPFSGFYYSWHDQELNYALESIFSDNNGNPIPSLVEKAFDCVDWKACHVAYAEKYTENFADKFSLSTLKFKELVSPKYYNFQTDRIFCDISLSEVTSIYSQVDKDLLKQYIKSRFTSRDGFISHYSNDIAEWPKDLSQWDHNEVGTLIEAYVDSENLEEHDLVEDAYEVATNIIYANLKDSYHLFKIADYLRTREERKYHATR